MFLIIRIIITAAYLKTDPDGHVLWGCTLEGASHLTAAAWSHIVWRHMRRRQLIEKGWKRIVGEGLSIALAGMFAIDALYWWPSMIVYRADFLRYGTATVFWVTLMQTLMITLIWYWPLVVILYFNRTRQLEVDHAEARAVAREAQLHALRGQVNPHFLFNSFNSLRALVATDPEQAVNAITQLASILRYSLSQADRLLVPLREELTIVERHLDLEKLRLGPRLDVVAEIGGEIDSAVFPPLLLQGLIENAVKYGPANRKAGGTVFYSVQVENGGICIRVENPGRIASPRPSGLGLRNLHDRLRLLYGSTAAFTLQDTEQDRVVAKIILPAHPPPETLVEQKRREPAACPLARRLLPALAPLPVAK